MRKKFVFATNNSHKLEEVTANFGREGRTSQHEGYQMRY